MSIDSNFLRVSESNQGHISYHLTNLIVEQRGFIIIIIIESSIDYMISNITGKKKKFVLSNIKQEQ